MVFLFILDFGRLARGLAAVVYDIPKKREKVIAVGMFCAAKFLRPQMASS
tara:strand:- start:416 stop:565 length:150 start_codon:yes stop_codon:yes gene_type:complete